MTNSSISTKFLESVLELNPRVAAFDCDGTLWSGDAGEGFFTWSMQKGIVSEEIAAWARARHADYKAGLVDEDVMCGEMCTMYHGLREADLQRATNEFFELDLARGIFPEMRDLVLRLRAAGTDVWAVSSSNHWIIRSGMRGFGIPADRILAAEAVVKDGVIVDDLIRVPSGPGKPDALREVLAEPPDCAFGNSIWDREMLEMTPHPFAINPTPRLEEIAESRGWRIYQPKKVDE
ncbi:MAG TPA: HAD-IB family phosphatase [Terriglobales bacterium]|jgi:HAD superfamily phosphoserine phosphatase-like hydrolase|nr:HAD-IB family phosphatase [Terriglobales bacterium]